MAIEVIGKIKPKNNGTFPLMDAEDVLMPDGTRLSGYTPFIPISQEDYDLLVSSGTVDESKYYVIVGDSE
jgi:hypothetical protein